MIDIIQDPEANAVLVSGSAPALVYIDDATLKRLAGSTGWFASGSNIFSSGAAEIRLRNSASNKLYGSGVGIVDLLASIRLNLGATGGDAEFGSGSADTLAIRKTSGTTALDLGSSTLPMRDIWLDGDVSVQAGDASATWAKGNGCFHVDVTAVGNVGAGTDTLMTYTIPASVLAADLSFIEWEMSGTFANNGNNKTLTIEYTTTPTTLLTVGPIAYSNVDWVAKGTIIRTSATAQKCSTVLAVSGASNTVNYTTAAATLSSSQVLRATAVGTSNDDIVQETMIVKWCKGVA